MPPGLSKIGIFGGTFNPVHIAHLAIAERFADVLRLNKCIFIPANISPFKTGSTPDIETYHRINMLKLAIRGNTRFGIDLFEIEHGGVSHTIDTIRHISNSYIGADLSILIGSDHFKEFEKWKDWQEIVKLTTLCLVARPDIMNDNEISSKIRMISGIGRTPQLIEIPGFEVSSTYIREQVKSGNSIRYLVTKKVGDYIKAHSLYTNR